MTTAPRLTLAITAEPVEHRPEGYVRRWQDDAACIDLDPDLFFPSRGDTIDDRCVAACQVCPVLADCRDHALHHEKHGYWAGMSERQRRQTRKALGIALIETVPLLPAMPTEASEVARLTAEGHSVAEIADFLDITERQVQRHRAKTARTQP